jgi:thiosulfate/3-mercaptopyruvate sulfurtransferase
MMNLQRKTFLVGLVCAAVLFGILSPLHAGETGKESLYVSPEWLKENRDKVILIDARPKSLYDKGHIPGAVNAEWTYFANMKGTPGTPGWGDLYPRETLAKRIGALGVNGKKPVVVYCDPGGWGQDGWIVWILRLSGIADARMLEGGFSAWRAAGGAVSTTPEKPKAVAFSIPSFQGGYNVTTPWLREKLDEVVVIDARTPFEYQGARIFQEKRGGHIPGAVNIPFDSVFREDQTVKEPEEIRELFGRFGISPEDEIIVYDTAGVRSAYLVMVLRMAGFENARNYDSSFQEWAGNMELAVVEGDKPGEPQPKVETAPEQTGEPPTTGNVSDHTKEPNA